MTKHPTYTTAETVRNVCLYIRQTRPLGICSEMARDGMQGYKLELAPLTWIMEGLQFMPAETLDSLIKCANCAQTRGELE